MNIAEAKLFKINTVKFGNEQGYILVIYILFILRNWVSRNVSWANEESPTS